MVNFFFHCCFITITILISYIHDIHIFYRYTALLVQQKKWIFSVCSNSFVCTDHPASIECKPYTYMVEMDNKMMTSKMFQGIFWFAFFFVSYWIFFRCTTTAAEKSLITWLWWFFFFFGFVLRNNFGIHEQRWVQINWFPFVLMVMATCILHFFWVEIHRIDIAWWDLCVFFSILTPMRIIFFFFGPATTPVYFREFNFFST